MDVETLADVNKLDAVVHQLGIEDSFEEPAHAVAKIQSELARLRSALTMIAYTEYGEDGGRRYPDSAELRSWARDALNKSAVAVSIFDRAKAASQEYRGVELDGFAEATYNECTLDDMLDALALGPDQGDMKSWKLSKTEWRDAILTAMAARVETIEEYRDDAEA